MKFFTSFIWLINLFVILFSLKDSLKTDSESDENFDKVKKSYKANKKSEDDIEIDENSLKCKDNALNTTQESTESKDTNYHY